MSQRYLRLGQTYGREEIGSAKVLQVDSSSLHSTGVLVWSPCFDVEVLHQSDARKEGLTLLGSRKKLGDETERFEDAVLALQCVGGCRQSMFHGELK